MPTVYRFYRLLYKQRVGQPFIDLIYIDLPFNSGAYYQGRKGSAFSDVWGQVDPTADLTDLGQLHPHIAQILTADFLGLSRSDTAYLAMIAHRLWYMHALLKSSGSLYLHCDSATSHYLKILLDLLFGRDNFQNEIIWKRTSAHSDSRRFGRIIDSILFYSKDHAQMYFSTQHQDYDEDYLQRFYCYHDQRGRYRLSDLTGPGVNNQDEAWRGYHPAQRGRSWSVPRKAIRNLSHTNLNTLSTIEKLDLLYSHGLIHISGKGVPAFKRYLDTMPGVPLQNLWTDILPVGPRTKEKTHYPTQKPEALLERIILDSSQEGHLVADFFCGSGTSLVVANKLGRRWLGRDSNQDALEISRQRL